MKSDTFFRAALSMAALVAMSCATGAGAGTAGTGARPVAKERVETVLVPVLVGEKTFLANGSLDRSVVYVLDAAKKEVLRRTVFESTRTEPVETLTRVLTPGRVVETASNYEGQMVTQRTIDFDAAGRKVREALEGPRSAKGSVSEWEYDAAGLALEWRVRDASGVLLATTKYESSEGRLKVARMLDPAGAFEGMIEYAYDREGNLISRTYRDASGRVERSELLTWKDGALIEERSFKGSSTLERRLAFEIGPDGVPVAATLYDSLGRTREKRIFEYVYREEQRIVVYYE